MVVIIASQLEVKEDNSTKRPLKTLPDLILRSKGRYSDLRYNINTGSIYNVHLLILHIHVRYDYVRISD